VSPRSGKRKDPKRFIVRKHTSTGLKRFQGGRETGKKEWTLLMVLLEGKKDEGNLNRAGRNWGGPQLTFIEGKEGWGGKDKPNK